MGITARIYGEADKDERESLGQNCHFFTLFHKKKNGSTLILFLYIDFPQNLTGFSIVFSTLSTHLVKRCSYSFSLLFF